jgi:hypothetical protein
MSGTKEPEYQGKRLSEWMENVGRGRMVNPLGTLNIRGKPNETYVFLGSSSPPAVFSFVGGKSESERLEGENAIKRIGTSMLTVVRPMLLLHDSTLRNHLDSWIHKSPRLERLFPTSAERRENAMAAVYFLGEDAVPFVISICDDEATPKDVRCFAAYTFLRFPKNSLGALPALKLTAKDSDPFLAELSTWAIEAIESAKQHSP